MTLETRIAEILEPYIKWACDPQRDFDGISSADLYRLRAEVLAAIAEQEKAKTLKSKLKERQNPWRSLIHEFPEMDSNVEIQLPNGEVISMQWKKNAARGMPFPSRTFWRTPLPPIQSFSLRRNK